MVGESVPVHIAIPPQFRDDDEGCAIAVLRQRLRVLPQLVDQPIGPFDRVEIERIGAIVRDVDVPEVHDQQRWRETVHDLLGHEERQLVSACWSRRIVEVLEQRFRERRFQLVCHRAARLEDLPSEPFVSAVERQHHALGERLPIVDARPGVRAHCGLDRVDQQLLREHDVGGVGVAEGPERAAAHAAEALVGGNHPRLFGRQRALLPKQLENRGRHRRLAAIRIDVLPAAGYQGPGRIEMAGDALVASDRIQESLRHDLGRQVGNVHPSFARQRIFVAHAAAEGHDDDAALGLADRRYSLRKQAVRQAPVGQTRRQHAKHITATQERCRIPE